MPPAFEPLDPEYQEAVRRSFAQQGLMGIFGARLRRVRPGQVVIAVPFRPQLSQQDGWLHAGVVIACVDSACGYAALTLMPAGSRVLAVSSR
jgi:acyl-coenzyme A thioesterase PaaI-like protein